MRADVLARSYVGIQWSQSHQKEAMPLPYHVAKEVSLSWLGEPDAFSLSTRTKDV